MGVREREIQLRELWAMGKSIPEIAEQLNVTQSNVKEMRRRLGLPRRQAGRRRVE